jgi:hypothetical protein
VDTGIEIVRARKPSPTKYVSIFPEKRYAWIVPEDRESRRDPYLVAPAIGQTLMPLCRRAQLVAWVDPDSNYGIWPILQEGSTGEINEYSLSAMKKIDMAVTGGKWYCFRVPKGQRGYGLWEADSDLGIPKWPPEGIEFLIKKAFEDRVILDVNHPLLKALRGKSVA